MTTQSNYLELYQQILPYMEANSSSSYGLAIGVFFAFLGFGLFAFFTSKKKSGSIALTIIVIVGSMVSGFLYYLTERDAGMNPYIVNGTVKEFGYNSAYESWFFTLIGKEAFEILEDGNTKQHFKPKTDFLEENEYYYRVYRKKDIVSNQDPMIPYFYSIYDNLKEGQNVTLLIIPNESPLGHIVDGKLIVTQ